MKKILYLLPFLVLSCQNDNDNLTKEEMQEISIIKITTNNVVFDEQTRATPYFNPTASTFTPSFSNKDSLGIFPFYEDHQSGYQLTFPLVANEGERLMSFNFEGGGWFMSSDFRYQAYLPYNYNNRNAKEIPVSFVSQKQKGNNNSDLLGPSYLVTSGITTPTGNKLFLTMSARVNVAKIDLTLPVAATYKKLYLITDDNDFVWHTTYNLENSTYSNEPVKGNVLSLSLEDIVTSSANEVRTFFMCVCPVDLTGKNLKVAVVDAENNIYVANYSGAKKFNEGRGKGIVINGTTDSFVKNNTYSIPDDGSKTGITGTAPDFVSVSGI